MPIHARHHSRNAFPASAVRHLAQALSLGALVFLSGCHVRRSHDAHDNVSIDTPVGGLSVKRDSAAALEKMGLPAYPGSTPVADGDGNHDSANVDLSFGGFKLQVLVVKLRTTDDRGKVEAFYRTALAQYSDVIACSDDQPIGTPTKTGMGLSCAHDKHVSADSSAGNGKKDGLQLKAGSPSRQHLVSLWTTGGETRVDLIALELPKGLVD